MSSELLKIRRRHFFTVASSTNTKLYLSSSNTENTEEPLTRTYNAAGRPTVFYLWTDSGLLCDSGVSVLGYTGQYSSVTYDPSTGKINANITRNTDTGNAKSGSFTIAYRSITLTVNMTQSKDEVASTSDTVIGVVEYTSSDFKPGYNSQQITYYYYEYTLSLKANVTVKTTTTYVSGNTSTSTGTKTVQRSSGRRDFVCVTWPSNNTRCWVDAYDNHAGNMNVRFSRSNSNAFDTQESDHCYYSSSAFTKTMYCWAKFQEDSDYHYIGPFTVSWDGTKSGLSCVSIS